MNFSMIASGLLALAVGLGAFGAHGLKDRLDTHSMGIWEKAVFYHFVHATGMLVIALMTRSGALREFEARPVCWLLLSGVVFFSGSLYALALSGFAVLGAVTPLGGLSFMAAWLLLAYRLTA
jgi:uncharacterized membrane protein YgdD (TMEM256/DUF423 family)